MKYIFIIIILTFFKLTARSQDTTVTWIHQIDTNTYKLYFDKHKIPNELLKYIEVDNLKEIANPNKPFRSGCIGSSKTPNKKLNWLAKDNKNHFVISISFGGKGRVTKFYFLDKDKNSLNINEISFGHNYVETTSLNFASTTIKIKHKDFSFVEYEVPDTKE